MYISYSETWTHKEEYPIFHYLWNKSKKISRGMRLMDASNVLWVFVHTIIARTVRNLRYKSLPSSFTYSSSIFFNDPNCDCTFQHFAAEYAFILYWKQGSFLFHLLLGRLKLDPLKSSLETVKDEILDNFLLNLI